MKAKYSAFSATKEMHGSSNGFSAAGFQKKAYILLSFAFLVALAIGSFAIHKIPPVVFLIYLIMSQKINWNESLAFLWRMTTCAIMAPGQPQSSSQM